MRRSVRHLHVYERDVEIGAVFDPRNSLIETARADHFEPRGSENVPDHVATYIVVLEDKDPGTSIAAGSRKSYACLAFARFRRLQPTSKRREIYDVAGVMPLHFRLVRGFNGCVPAAA